MEPTEVEVQRLLRDLAADGKPTILSALPGFSDAHVPLCVLEVLPRSLTDLYKEEHLYLEYHENHVLAKCEEVLGTIKITPAKVH